MNKKDKIIIKDTAVVVVESLVSKVPGLDIAWGLSKALYGAGMQLRQDRALEWVEMIRDNPSIFTKEILDTEEFQDGFVYSLEKYLTERNIRRRIIAKKVFCGFGANIDKLNFKLERLMSTIQQLSPEDLEILQIYKDGTIRQWYKNQFKDATEDQLDKLEADALNVGQIGQHILSNMKMMSKFNDPDYTLERLNRLSSLGLLTFGIQAGWDVSTSVFKISVFGKEFIEYIS